MKVGEEEEEMEDEESEMEKEEEEIKEEVLLISCLILGTPTVLTIEISNHKTISLLKNAIKKRVPEIKYSDAFLRLYTTKSSSNGKWLALQSNSIENYSKNYQNKLMEYLRQENELQISTQPLYIHFQKPDLKRAYYRKGGKDYERIHILVKLPEPIHVVKRANSDEQYIQNESLNILREEDVIEFLQNKMDKVLDSTKLKECEFPYNCLEYNLSHRLINYEMDDEDNIKVLLAVSGAGKTRMLLELLTQTYGYYFVTSRTRTDFGSGDLNLCMEMSLKKPIKVSFFIDLLYFIRVFVCSYLVQNGYDTPAKILFAQLHPVKFFGCDIFKVLFGLLADKSIFLQIPDHFNFVCIDEIQRTLYTKEKFYTTIERPFFSPLVLYSKSIFKKFIISGTGMDFMYINELLNSATLKRQEFYNHVVVSPFKPLNYQRIISYCHTMLNGHFEKDTIDNVIQQILEFKLCHGRARFLAFLIDIFIEHHDIVFAFSLFLEDISNVESPYFPLKFFRIDSKRGMDPLLRIIGRSTLSATIIDMLTNLFIKGNAVLDVDGDQAANAIYYGLGFCTISEGSVISVAIKELAIIHCLRYLIPFEMIVNSLSRTIRKCPNAQSMGYVLEYIVAAAFVANLDTKLLSELETFHGTLTKYLSNNDSNRFICYPDNCCGPDIVFKYKGVVHFIQVKFLKNVSKKQILKAVHTTDPDHFYCNRTNGFVLKGYEERKKQTSMALGSMPTQRYVFIHTSGDSNFDDASSENVERIDQKTKPTFFNNIDPKMWDHLNKIRKELDEEN